MPSSKLLTLKFDRDQVAAVGFQIPSIILMSGAFFRKAQSDVLEVRPLTLTAIVRGVGGNLVRMSYWRFMVTLRILGLLSTPELGVLKWSHLTYRVWDYQMWNRLRVVKAARKLCRIVRRG